MNKFFVIVVSVFALTLVGCGAPTAVYQNSSQDDCCGGHRNGPTAAIYSGVRVRTGEEHSRKFYDKLDSQVGTRTETKEYSGRLFGKGPPARGFVSQTTETVYVQHGTHAAPPILGPIAEFFGAKPRSPW